MNKIILVLLIIIIAIQVIYFLGSKAGFSPDNDQSIENLPANDSLLLLKSPERVTWYEIIGPVKNEGKGYLFLRTENVARTDTSRISAAQAAAFIGILKEKDVRYSWQTKSLIVTRDLNMADTSNKKAF